MAKKSCFFRNWVSVGFFRIKKKGEKYPPLFWLAVWQIRIFLLLPPPWIKNVQYPLSFGRSIQKDIEGKTRGRVAVD